MLLIRDNAKYTPPENYPPQMSEMWKLQDCSRALKVVTMTSRITLDVKDSIAGISERDLIQLSFQQRPPGFCVGKRQRRGQGGSREHREVLVAKPGERMCLGQVTMGQSSSLPVCSSHPVIPKPELSA